MIARETGRAETVESADGHDDRRRWNERYRSRADERAGVEAPALLDPTPPLLRMRSVLPTAGRAVDLAGGDGGVALHLAGLGLDATVVDVSDVALEQAEAIAAGHELGLTTHRLDLAGMTLAAVLETVGPPAPAVVTCFNYLDRTLLASVADGLPSGARFLVAVATTTNLERHPRPPAPYLLEPGELVELVVGSAPERLRLLHRREGWAEDRHRSELAVVAR